MMPGSHSSVERSAAQVQKQVNRTDYPPRRRERYPHRDVNKEPESESEPEDDTTMAEFHRTGKQSDLRELDDQDELWRIVDSKATYSSNTRRPRKKHPSAHRKSSIPEPLTTEALHDLDETPSRSSKRHLKTWLRDLSPSSNKDEQTNDPERAIPSSSGTDHKGKGKAKAHTAGSNDSFDANFSSTSYESTSESAEDGVDPVWGWSPRSRSAVSYVRLRPGAHAKSFSGGPDEKEEDGGVDTDVPLLEREGASRL